MVENIVRQWARDHNYDADAIKVYGSGNPRVVIVGECHNIHEMKDEQMDLCARLGSDTLAHEMLANHIYNPKKRILQRNPLYSVHPASQEYLGETIRSDKVVRDRFHKYDIRSSIYGYKEFQQWKKDNAVNVLLNQFEEEQFYYFFDPLRINIAYTLSRLPNRINKVVGCDIDHAKSCFLIAKYKQQGLLNECKFNMSDLHSIPDYFEIRERRMSKVISDSLTLTEMPLLVIVGANHIRQHGRSNIIYEEWPFKLDSWIHKVLPEYRISYITVDQQKSRVYRNHVKQFRERYCIYAQNERISWKK